MQQITGFEFEVMWIDSTRTWVRLQGAGGLFGDGALCSLNAPKRRRTLLPRVTGSLLAKARAELAREGYLWLYRDHNDPAERIRPACTVSSVLDCRPLLSLA